MSRTILYIEDDDASRLLVQRMLNGVGYNVVVAERGLQGIDLARHLHPDLILTDLNLPDMSGYEIVTALRGDSEFNETPIVALTATGYGHEQQVALAAGITGYLTKPLDVDLVLGQIEYYLHGGQDRLEDEDDDTQVNARVTYMRELIKRMETRVRELEEANASLSKLDKMKETFIQITAHELRTPLTLIFGYSRLLEDHPILQKMINDDPGMLTLVQGLVDAINRMHQIIDEIIIISRIMTNQIDLSPSPLNLGSLVEKVIESYQEALLERRLTLYFRQDDWPRTMRADADMLRIAMSNLIGNAIKYTPDGGEIYLKARTYPEHVKFLVEDTGVGIDPQEQERIFEEFHTISDVKLHSTSKTAFNGGGLGLGLPVCKGIVEAHGGRIWVESVKYDPETCPGSTFHVFLPLIFDR